MLSFVLLILEYSSIDLKLAIAKLHRSESRDKMELQEICVGNNTNSRFEKVYSPCPFHKFDWDVKALINKN